MALPAHHTNGADEADETDDELSDEQVHKLLEDAERSLRAKQAQSLVSDAPSTLPKLNAPHMSGYLKTKGSVTKADPSKLVNKDHRALAEGIKKIEDPIQAKKQRLEEKKATAGSDWFNLPRTELTPELRRDLQLLKMRNVLDPKRFYKKQDSKSDVPAFSQIGTIIEGPTEFYNGRINNKDRKKTFVDEVLAQESETGRFKKKYNEIQKAKTSGKKDFYKALKAKRKGRVEKR